LSQSKHQTAYKYECQTFHNVGLIQQTRPYSKKSIDTKYLQNVHKYNSKPQKCTQVSNVKSQVTTHIKLFAVFGVFIHKL